MHEGAIEPTVIPRNPLDVLAQQLVAACAERPWTVDELYALVRGARELRASWAATRSRRCWACSPASTRPTSSRSCGRASSGTAPRARVGSRRDARTVAVISGGTIPDRGLFPVFLADDDDGATGRRSRHARSSGAHRRPARGRAGRGDGLRGARGRGHPARRVRVAHRVDHPRPRARLAGAGRAGQGAVLEGRRGRAGRSSSGGRWARSRARSASRRRRGDAAGTARRAGRCGEHHDLDELAARNLLAYLDEEREVTGALPTDRTIVLQRFRDELGDWRICLLTPFGARVHAPWALAIEARLRERTGLEVQPIWSDDGIVIRLPAAEETLGWAGPEDGRARRWTAAGRGGHRADARRRPCSSPRTRSRSWSSARSAGRRCSPAASGRTRRGRCCCRAAGPAAHAAVADAPAVGAAAGGGQPLRLLPDHPRDVPRVPPGRVRPARAAGAPGRHRAARDARRERRDAARVAVRELAAVRLHRLLHVRGRRAAGRPPGPGAGARPRPAARAAGRRGAARAARRRRAGRARAGAPGPDAGASGRLGRPGARPAAPAGRPDRPTRCADRVRGADARGRAAGRRGVARGAGRRPARGRGAHRRRGALDRDRGRRRATGTRVGVAPPRGVPEAFLAPTRDALGGLLARWARHHGPFLAGRAGRRAGACPVGVVEAALERLLAAGVLLRGEFRPGGVEREWCDPEVLRLLRRRSLARLRREVEPVEPRALGRFLPAGRASASHGTGPIGWPRSSPSWRACRCRRASSSGTSCRPASRAISRGCSTSWARRARWCGSAAGSLGRDDGRVALWRPDRIALTSSASEPATSAHAPLGPPASATRRRSGPGSPIRSRSGHRTPTTWAPGPPPRPRRLRW